MEHVLAHKHLVRHTDDLVFSVFVEDDDIVDVRTVADKLVLLQPCADEAIGAIDVEFLVGLSHLCSLDGVEIANLREARMFLAVFVLEELEPTGGHFHQIGQITINFLNLGLDTGHQFVGLFLIELQDALHLDLQQFQDVVLRHLTNEGGIVGRQTVVDMLTDLIDVRRLLELTVLIDTLFDENLFQRLEMELF